MPLCNWAWCLSTDGLMWPLILFIPVVTEVFLDGAEERQTHQRRWTESEKCVTLIISLRCDSGSRPAMGRIRIFCVLEQRSARDSVIFLWVALSVEWGLEIWKTTNVRFKVTVHVSTSAFYQIISPHIKTVLSGHSSPLYSRGQRHRVFGLSVYLRFILIKSALQIFFEEEDSFTALKFKEKHNICC